MERWLQMQDVVKALVAAAVLDMSLTVRMWQCGMTVTCRMLPAAAAAAP